MNQSTQKTASCSMPDLKNLKQIFQKYPEIRAVYLFGSVATGKAGKESDLDLAIVPYTSAIRTKRLDLLHDFAKAGFCNVDLVFLDIDDIVLAYEAVRLNNLIYQTDDFDKGEMYSLVVRKFLDFRPYLKVQRDSYKRRLLNGTT